MARLPEPIARVIAQAFDALAQAVPTVVVWSSPNRPYSAVSFAKGWPTKGVTADDEVASAVGNALRDGPVLFLPSLEDVFIRVRPDTLTLLEDMILRIRPASNGSLLSVLIPLSTLTSDRSRQFRELLQRSWQPVLIVQGTSFLTGIYLAFPVALMFLAVRSSVWRPMKMFKMPAQEEPDAIDRDFSRLLRQDGGKSRFGYVIREPVLPGMSLGVDRHDPELMSRIAGLARFGSTVPLHQLFIIEAGTIHSTANNRLIRKTPEGGAVRILRGREISQDGVITPPDEESRWAQASEQRQLKAGDIVMRSIQNDTDQSRLIVAEVLTHHLPVVADQSVIVLRPRRSLDRHQRQLALLFLRSRLARAIVEGFGSGGVHLSARVLRDIDVPQPDEELAVALDELEQAVAQFDAWRSEADALMGSVFDGASSLEARRRIVTSGRRLRLRVEAATLLDDLGHTVRTRFPFPIASRWRNVEAKVSGDPTVEAYEAILDCAEALLCYSAILSLVMAYESGISVHAVDAIRAKLASGRSGPSFGDWTAVLEEVARGRHFRALGGDVPLGEVRSLLADRETDLARQRLAVRRNDHAHLRRLDPEELPSVLKEVLVDLTVLLARAVFVSDLPLIVVRDARWDAFSGMTAVAFGELMGDHAVVPTKTLQIVGPHVEQGSLYVLDSLRVPHLLRPFLIGRLCPVCRNWSTFAIDRFVDGRCVMKSLEHGHTIEDDELANVMSAVGLLP